MGDGRGRAAAHIVRPSEITQDERRVWEGFRRVDQALLSPFLSFGYVDAVAEVRGDVRVCIVERNGRVVAFLPYQLGGALRRALRHGEPAGGAMSDAFGLIAAADFAIAPLELLRLTRLSCLSFTHLLRAQERFGLAGTRIEGGLGIDLSSGPESYWSDLRKTKGHFSDDTARRRSRIASEVGALRFEAEEADSPRFLESLIVAKIDQYRRTGTRNALAPSWTRDLLRTLARRRDPDCQAVLSTLHAGDVWAASHFGLRSGPVLHWWFPVYNPTLSPYAPGRLLLAAMIDGARTLGVTRIDRGTGTQPAKRDFANLPQEFWRGTWWRPGLRGILARTELAIAWRLHALGTSGRRAST